MPIRRRRIDLVDGELPPGVEEDRQGQRVYLRIRHRRNAYVTYWPCVDRDNCWDARDPNDTYVRLPTEALARAWCVGRITEMALVAGRNPARTQLILAVLGYSLSLAFMALDEVTNWRLNQVSHAGTAAVVLGAFSLAYGLSITARYRRQ